MVRIEAFADPTGPVISREEMEAVNVAEEMERLIDQLKGLSEQEMMDQVYRRLTIHLCGPCYRTWIENPAGP